MSRRARSSSPISNPDAEVRGCRLVVIGKIVFVFLSSNVTRSQSIAVKTNYVVVNVLLNSKLNVGKPFGTRVVLSFCSYFERLTCRIIVMKKKLKKSHTMDCIYTRDGNLLVSGRYIYSTYVEYFIACS